MQFTILSLLLLELNFQLNILLLLLKMSLLHFIIWCFWLSNCFFNIIIIIMVIDIEGILFWFLLGFLTSQDSLIIILGILVLIITKSIRLNLRVQMLCYLIRIRLNQMHQSQMWFHFLVDVIIIYYMFYSERGSKIIYDFCRFWLIYLSFFISSG